MNRKRPSYEYELALKKVLNPDNPFYRPLSDYGVTEEECWNYVKKMKEGVLAHFNYQKRMLKRIQNISIGLYTSGLFITIALFLICAIMGSGMLLIAIIGSVAALITAPIASIGMKKVADKRAKRLKDFMPPVDERIERLIDDYEKKKEEQERLEEENRLEEEERLERLKEITAEEIQSTGTFDPMYIRHVVKRLQELNEEDKLMLIHFQDLCLRANKEYERVSRDIAMGITNHYLHSHHFPTPEKLAEQTGCNIHYCYAMLQEYRKQMNERLEKFADKKNVTAQDILYETYTVNEHVKTGNIIGYTESPHTSFSTLIEESCYMNTGGHYDYVKEPIYEYKTVQREVKDYQLHSISPFVPFDFEEKVKNRWNDLSIENKLNFNLLQHYVSIVYPPLS